MSEGNRPAAPRSVTPASRVLIGGASAALLLLAFESLPVVRAVQVAPWTGLLAVLLLPLALPAARHRGLTPVAAGVLLFGGWAVAHSLVAIGVEAVSGGASGVRVVSWLRQLVALGVGLAVFLVMRVALPRLGARRVAGLVSLASLPAVLLSAFTVTAVLMRSRALHEAEKAVRAVFVPTGFTWWARTSGLSLEPSHLAFLLAVMALPASLALIVGSRGWPRAAWAVLAVGQLAAGAWTFSGTGYLVLAAMAGAALLTPWRRVGIWSATAVIVALLGLIAWAPRSYLTYRIERMTASLVGGGDRLDDTVANTAAGAVGPFLRLGSSLVAVGYGLGGTATHLDKVLPEGFRSGVERVSWPGMPNLRSLTGRVLAETGIVGLALLLLMIARGWRALGSGGLPRDAPFGPGLAVAGRMALAGLLMGHVIKFGSFALPYLWIWLALADWPTGESPGAAAPGADRTSE